MRQAWRIVLGSMVLLSGPKIADAAFHPTPVTEKESCQLQLAAAQGIPHKCWRLHNPQAKLPVWRSALQFEFGQLSRSQWQNLHKAYGSWQNHRLPPYDPKQHYTLMDFMPPLMQALNGHQFHSEQVPLRFAGTAQATAMANCWGTLYEILRTSQQKDAVPYTFMVGPEQIGAWLQQASEPVTGAARLGDILLIQHQRAGRTYLDHVALVVDDQIFFEKAGTGNDTPYRLVDLKMLQQSWRPDLFTFTFRRLKPGERLRSPQIRFGLHSPEAIAQFPELQEVEDAIATKFSVVWFDNQGTPSRYYYQIQPIDRQALISRPRLRLSKPK